MKLKIEGDALSSTDFANINADGHFHRVTGVTGMTGLRALYNQLHDQREPRALFA